MDHSMARRTVSKPPDLEQEPGRRGVTQARSARGVAGITPCTAP